MCKWRDLIENCFQRLKEFRRTATRYDKTDTSFTAALYLSHAAQRSPSIDLKFQIVFGIMFSNWSNFTHFPTKLFIFLHTAAFCSHKISMIFILDIDVGSEFCESTETKSTLKNRRPILGNRCRGL
jgi:hypothetical protein